VIVAQLSRIPDDVFTQLFIPSEGNRERRKRFISDGLFLVVRR
jgi:hypothetical protein